MKKQIQIHDLPRTLSEMKTWCEESQDGIIDLLDKVFDKKIDLSSEEAQTKLKLASEILKEIEEIEEEIEEILL